MDRLWSIRLYPRFIFFLSSLFSNFSFIEDWIEVSESKYLPVF
nr:MAG TPA: hypothetical protein [Caudoviricetes sp.]